MTELDEIDARILNKLQIEGRMAVVDLATHVNLSPTACHKRIKRLEEGGIITGYGATVSSRALGYQVEAFVFVSIERQVKAVADAFKAAVEKLSGVRAYYLLSGETDFLVHVVATDFDAYNHFILNQMISLPGARSVRTAFVLDKGHKVQPLSPPEAA